MKWGRLVNADLKTAAGDPKFTAARDYLKLDTADDDAVLLQCLKAAVRYVASAVGCVPEGDPTADMLVYAITQDLYDNRELMQMDIQQKKTIEYTYRSIILQLQCRYDLDEKETGPWDL